MRITVLALLMISPLSLAEDIDADRSWDAGTVALKQPLRVVRDGVTLDFGKAVFRGAAEGTRPDLFTGIGLIIEGRKNVTIRGGRFHGFKCAILIKDCEKVVLEGVDVSRNFRQHLGSTPEREDDRDWLRPHDNDQQEWRKKYGAGICLENCIDCIVRECVGRNQQNGVLLDRCTSCEVYDNDFSFNSGWGCALWRSSENLICHNSLDWCVRGYSHGVYDRGQDSAGILVFEQCHRNAFFRNSATHGGDGFFLYAGNETLRKTGKGGCNHNLVLNNDFSHAVANAIEATFSGHNSFVGNRCDDSNYGVWAGYSYRTTIEGNQFGNNSIAGVAIEHGQNNRITFNNFSGNPRGVFLWWDVDADLLATPFAQQREQCPSRTYVIAHNFFEGDKTAVHLQETAGVVIAGNHFEDVAEVLRKEGKCDGVIVKEERLPDVHGSKFDRDFPGKRNPLRGIDLPRGRRHIMIDEWGPIDPSSHAVFPREITAWGRCRFHVLGGGEFEVRGLPDGLSAAKRKRGFAVHGGDGLTPFSATVVTGGKEFPIRGIVLNAKWKIKHWKWKQDPRLAWEVGEPFLSYEYPALDFTWAMDGPKRVKDRFATRAETKMKLPAGRYELRTVSDDGVRVIVNGKIVQEDWTWHAPKENRCVIELPAGVHSIVVEHFELDGYAMLRFDLRPVK